MYQSGQLKITTPPCDEYIRDEEIGGCDEQYLDPDHGQHFIYDSSQRGTPKCGAGTVYLPHSCDEWVIGGAEQIRALIDDLQAALEKIEAEKL